MRAMYVLAGLLLALAAGLRHNRAGDAALATHQARLRRALVDLTGMEE